MLPDSTEIYDTSAGEKELDIDRYRCMDNDELTKYDIEILKSEIDMSY